MNSAYNFNDIYLSITNDMYPDRKSRMPAPMHNLIDSHERKMIKMMDKEFFTTIHFFVGLAVFVVGLLLLSFQHNGFHMVLLLTSLALIFLGCSVCFVGQGKKDSYKKEYKSLEKHVANMKHLDTPITKKDDIKKYNNMVDLLESDYETNYFRNIKTPKYMHFEYLRNYQDIHDPITLTGN